MYYVAQFVDIWPGVPCDNIDQPIIAGSIIIMNGVPAAR